MPGFVDCIVFNQLPQGIQDYILSKKDMFKKEGLSEIESERKAIEDFKKETVDQLVSVHKQIGNDVFEKLAEPSKVEEKIPPPESPPKTEIQQEGEEGIKVTHEATSEIRKAEGLGDYEKNPQTIEQWNKEADKRIANGEMPSVIKKMQNGDNISEVDQIMMGRHIASLDAEVKKNPSNENLKALREAIELSDVAGSGWGRSGRARQETFLPDNSLGKYLLDEAASLSVENLPEKTKEQVIKEHEDLTKVREELVKSKIEIERLQNEALAKDEVKAIAKKVPRTADKKRDFGAEKQSLKDKLKQQIEDYKAAGKKLGIVADGGAESFVISAQMAKTIGQYVKVNIEEGVKKFEDLINKVYEDFKDLGISKRQIINVVAGEYKEKKPTRTELAAKLRDFKTEAVLLKKLEDERLGKATKTVKEQNKKSRRITDLENKVKEIRERNKDKTPIEKSEGERMANKRKFIQKSIDQIEADIKEGRFEHPKILPPIRLDKKTQALQDRLLQLETQQMIRRQKNEYEKSSRFSKGADAFWQVLGLRRFINAAIDFSILFRQAAPVTMNIAKYIPRMEDGKLRMNTAPKAIGNMFNVAFSPNKFKRFQYDLEKSEQGRLFTHFNGVFSNPSEVKMDKREEEFTNSILARFHQKIESSGNEQLKKVADISNRAWFSERAAAGLLNTIRAEEFTKGVKTLEKKGITPENSPDHYKELVKWNMNSTGRGNMLKLLEDSHAGRLAANRTYFGARLFAAKVNMLNPFYYAKMPKEVRVMAIRDMAGYTSSVILAGLALKATGANISFDPDDSDFLQPRFGNKVYDITGGSVGYIRTFLRVMSGTSKLVKDLVTEGEINRATGSYLKFMGWSAWKTLVANKLSPNTAYAYHFFTGKSAEYDAAGHLKPFDPLEIAKIYPLYVDGTIQAFEEGGVGDAMTILIPDLFGIGTQLYGEGGTGGGGGASTTIPKPEHPTHPKVPHPTR